eukprot:c14515_g1_i2.p2 GENE.c14515_g1_i2~~c14515_g1_i2.p2  ORF type:complete len:102 (-),score=12.51 c14515_g1_i2:266-571(-)
MRERTVVALDASVVAKELAQLINCLRRPFVRKTAVSSPFTESFCMVPAHSFVRPGGLCLHHRWAQSLPPWSFVITAHVDGNNKAGQRRRRRNNEVSILPHV